MRGWAILGVALVVLAGCGSDTTLDPDASCDDWADVENRAARRQLVEATLDALGSANPDGLSSGLVDDVTGYCETFPNDSVADVVYTIWLGRGQP